MSWPRRLTSQVHAEPHLAVVIGARTSYVSPADALKQVFGYAVATNVNSHDLKRKHGQWDKAVSLDTFFPWGPVIATADEIDVASLSFTCDAIRKFRADKMRMADLVAVGAQVVSWTRIKIWAPGGKNIPE